MTDTPTGSPWGRRLPRLLAVGAGALLLSLSAGAAQAGGDHFRVVSVDGQPPHPGDAGWKDTVPVYAHQTVVVRPYFDYYAGVYVFHCHAAEHGDMSMMGQMDVVA